MGPIDYIICMPVYKVSDRVRKCIKSLNDNEHLLLIDNTGENECSEFVGIEVEYQTDNIGVGRAWNIGLKRDHEWTFVMSSSMYFPNGFQNVIEKLKDYKGLMFRTTNAWHCNGINRKLVQEIGYIDENFYPGYLEDNDWDYRCILWGNPEYGNIEIDAICQVDGGATIDGLRFNIRALKEYHKRKWGGYEGLGTFKYPFNNPNNKLDYWEVKSIEQLKKEYA